MLIDAAYFVLYNIIENKVKERNVSLILENKKYYSMQIMTKYIIHFEKKYLVFFRKEISMRKYFLAIDIGASSGRHILAHLRNGKIRLEEVYRFWNGMDNVDGMLYWDVDRLFRAIITGMKKCKELNKIPVSVGIDTWG